MNKARENIKNTNKEQKDSANKSLEFFKSIENAKKRITVRLNAKTVVSVPKHEKKPDLDILRTLITYKAVLDDNAKQLLETLEKKYGKKN